MGPTQSYTMNQATAYPVDNTTTTTTTYTQPQPIMSNPISTNYAKDLWIEPGTVRVHPVIPAICSALIPGLGQVINRQGGKGASLFISFYVALIIVIAFCFIVLGFFILPFFIVFWALIFIDAFQINNKLRHGTPVMKGQCTNALIYYGSKIIKDGPVFVESKVEQQPEEYKIRMANLHQTVSQP